jgi:hypothetical protein
MIDLIDDRTMLIVGCTALVVAGLGVLRAVIWARREEASFSCSISHASVTALIRQVGYQSRASLTATSCRRRARSRTIPLA